jgi:hypothetical protein
MESQLLGFFQDRMATAYEEQTWAVALVSGMNAFIASNAELIRKGFKRWVLVSGITTISLLATAFVWSRHCIFVHYDKCLKLRIPPHCDHSFRCKLSTDSAGL